MHQHYKSKHNIQPTNKQLQPKNKQSRSSEADMDPQTKNAIVQKIERYARSQRLVYYCNICCYECDLKYEIKRHYLAKHRMTVQDVQQRPARSNQRNIQPISNIAPTEAAPNPPVNETQFQLAPKAKTKSVTNANNTVEDPLLPDYINGLNCRKCNEVFFYRNKLYEHYKLHSAEEEAMRQQSQVLKAQKNSKANGTTAQETQILPTPPPQQHTEAQIQLQQQTETQIQLQQQAETQIQLQQQTETQMQLQQQTETQIQLPQQEQPENQLLLQQQQQTETQVHVQQQTEMQIQYQEQQSQLQQLQILQQLPQPHQEVVITTTPLDNSITTFNNVDPMSLVLTPNNNTLNNPAAPLTPSSSSTYTLPSDAIPQIVEMEQTIETDMDFDFNGDALFEDFDDVDVENESDDNLRNIVLTSDDDFDDMLEQSDTQSRTTPLYCAQCQKTFLSQYQFENHMFLHRGERYFL